MTVEEIFSKLINHMRKGVQYHYEMARAYEFLGLWGYAHCQDSHQFEEEKNLTCLNYYYATHYFKLIPLDKEEENKIISSTWYKYSAQAVDIKTRRDAIKELMNKWIEWEKLTKELYQTMRLELASLSELDAALELDKYIRDVSKELSHAQKKLLTLESHNFDMTVIVEESEKMLVKYRKKLGW